MRLAERYAEMRGADGTRVHEPERSPPRRIPELEIQARWFAGEFGRKFKTVAGEDLQIVQFGIWNREAGPDFVEAAISLNGAPALRGSIELDPEARDWERHGHATNADYEAVVLHVFTQNSGAEFFTRTARHRNVPQLALNLRALADAPPNPSPIAKLGKCVGPLRELSQARVGELLDAAAQFRLRKKAARLARWREAHGDDEALFQALAATLGYKANALPFTLLAQRLPLALLRKNMDSADALLFGVSGFLEERDLSRYEPATRTYLRGLWDKWWARRAGFSQLVLDKSAWRLSGIRPVNHPQRRLAALTQIVKHWINIRKLEDPLNMAGLRKFLTASRDDYWDFHYTLTSAKSTARMALVGSSRVTEMLANVFFPRAILRDETQWDDYAKLPAALSNRRVKIAAIRLFGGWQGDLLKSVARQQGLLQIYEDFCMQDDSDCARCRFPRQLAQWR